MYECPNTIHSWGNKWRWVQSTYEPTYDAIEVWSRVPVLFYCSPTFKLRCSLQRKMDKKVYKKFLFSSSSFWKNVLLLCYTLLVVPVRPRGWPPSRSGCWPASSSYLVRNYIFSLFAMTFIHFRGINADRKTNYLLRYVRNFPFMLTEYKSGQLQHGLAGIFKIA